MGTDLTEVDKVAKGKVEIDEQRCKGCSLCIEACPRKVLALSKDPNSKGYYFAMSVVPEQCTGCTMCAQMCPDTAIKVFRL